MLQAFSQAQHKEIVVSGRNSPRSNNIKISYSKQEIEILIIAECPYPGQKPQLPTQQEGSDQD